MDSLLLHRKTTEQARAFLQNPSHGLLISGPSGSGKYSLARYLAASLVGIDEKKLDNYPYFSLISRPDNKQEIPIEATRALIKNLQLKPVLSSGGKAQKIVLIDQAHTMSEEAQNALLKLLEEPPPSTIFILTLSSDKSVLPTIASRVQKISLTPVDLAASQQFFSNQSAKAVESAWSLSQGASGLMSAILQEDQEHSLKRAVDEAKKVLKMNKYERLIFLESLSNNRDELQVLLEALNRVLSALHQNAIKADKKNLSRRLTKSRQLINQSLEALSKNSSIRLICLNLALNLPV